MSALPPRKVRLLFVDDDGSIRIFAGVMFNNGIFEITVAASTREADELLKKASFDIIVCDVMMPDENGIQYCNRLKKSGNSIPFVFLSAVGTTDSVQSGLASGALAYFIKPFDAQELQQKILALVGTSVTLPTNPPKKIHRWFNR